MLKYIALAVSTVIGAAAFTLPAQAGDDHRHGKKMHHKHHGDHGNRHRSHRHGGLAIGIGDDGLEIYSKRRHRHHEHRRRHRHHD